MIKMGRKTYESDAEEVIGIIDKCDIKYISCYENMTDWIALHPSKNSAVCFEHTECDDWSYSLEVSYDDLCKIFEHYGIEKPIFTSVLYSVEDGSSEYENPVIGKIDINDEMELI